MPNESKIVPTSVEFASITTHDFSILLLLLVLDINFWKSLLGFEKINFQALNLTPIPSYHI